MKSFISLFIILTVSLPAHALLLNVGHSTNLKYDGTVIPETVENMYIGVKPAAAYPAGTIVGWDLTAKDAASVVIQPTSGLAPACVVAPVACVVGAICKCQVYGLAGVLFDSTATASVAGHKVVVATGNAGYASARATDVATDVSLGYFYDAASASSSTNSVKIFVNLL